MASKHKEVRLEQRRVLEKKLELRLQKLAGEGIAKEKAQKDPIVKNLKSQIRETNVRVAASDKHVKKTQDLAKAKEEKLAAKAAQLAAPEAKPKKKAAPAEKDTKKKADAGGEAKKTRKKKEEA